MGDEYVQHSKFVFAKPGTCFTTVYKNSVGYSIDDYCAECVTSSAVIDADVFEYHDVGQQPDMPIRLNDDGFYLCGDILCAVSNHRVVLVAALVKSFKQVYLIAEVTKNIDSDPGNATYPAVSIMSVRKSDMYVARENITWHEEIL
jgi:hypothetical protein